MAESTSRTKASSRSPLTTRILPVIRKPPPPKCETAAVRSGQEDRAADREPPGGEHRVEAPERGPEERRVGRGVRSLTAVAVLLVRPHPVVHRDGKPGPQLPGQQRGLVR